MSVLLRVRDWADGSENCLVAAVAPAATLGQHGPMAAHQATPPPCDLCQDVGVEVIDGLSGWVLGPKSNARDQVRVRVQDD